MSACHKSDRKQKIRLLQYVSTCMTNMLHIIVSFCTEMLLDDDVGSGIKEMMESSNVASQLIKRNGEHISWLV